MSRNAPDRPSSAPLVSALDVRRNAAVGFSVGVALAVLAYLYRVVFVGPIPGAVDSPVLFLALAVVLSLTTGALVTTLLVARTAWRLAREEA